MLSKCSFQMAIPKCHFKGMWPFCADGGYCPACRGYYLKTLSTDYEDNITCFHFLIKRDFWRQGFVLSWMASDLIGGHVAGGWPWTSDPPASSYLGWDFRQVSCLVSCCWGSSLGLWACVGTLPTGHPPAPCQPFCTGILKPCYCALHIQPLLVCWHKQINAIITVEM